MVRYLALALAAAALAALVGCGPKEQSEVPRILASRLVILDGRGEPVTSVRLGQPVRFTLQVGNPTELTASLVHLDHPVALTITQETIEVWRSPEGASDPTRRSSLAPGQITSLTVDWNQKWATGVEVGPGSYLARARMRIPTPPEGWPMFSPSDLPFSIVQ